MFTIGLIHALPPEKRRCFGRKEAASYVGVSIGTFDKMVRSGSLPAPIRFGQRKVWDRNALDQVIDLGSGISFAPVPIAVSESPLDAWRRRHGQS